MGTVENSAHGRAALYARVSSDQQVQGGTIASQVEALQEWIGRAGLILDPELEFIDEGYSATTLVRPALERLRDLAALGLIDRLYVYAPDRLARKDAYQVLLLEEFERAGVTVLFLHQPLGEGPDARLLRPFAARRSGLAVADPVGRAGDREVCCWHPASMPRRLL